MAGDEVGEVIDWLLEGDVAVAYLTTRDLLHRDERSLQARIATEGVGAALLGARRPDGHWGRGFYQPKWTSSHYTLLELRNLGLAPDHPAAQESVRLILAANTVRDGGVNPNARSAASETCINGMTLNYASYFGAPEVDLVSLVDCLLASRVPDGGFNCHHRPPTHPVEHSSMHTTVSVLEGIHSYRSAGYGHRRDELGEAADASVEFLLRHELFKSERSGEVIRADFTRVHHPPRWHFDILRGLECLATMGAPRDPRMDAALELLNARQRPDGRWTATVWPGATHVPPDSGREPSRWATLRALRVRYRFEMRDDRLPGTLGGVGTSR
ncbi:hypothetical protein [Intrasporangium sp.]|jgi:hypothetical protein|uniref:hypothetical protein n=1 Tax=Intrasporangium sp. TaxID=1925024 RepID=UPI003365338C